MFDQSGLENIHQTHEISLHKHNPCVVLVIFYPESTNLQFMKDPTF